MIYQGVVWPHLDMGPWNHSSLASMALWPSTWPGCWEGGSGSPGEGNPAANRNMRSVEWRSSTSEASPPPGGLSAKGDMSKGSLCLALASGSVLTYSGLFSPGRYHHYHHPYQ